MIFKLCVKLKEIKMPEEIEKPWAVYGLITKFIGRIVNEDKNGYGCSIRYCEGQLYSASLWRNSSIQKFATSKEAINYLLSKNSEYSKRELTNNLLEDFPKAMKQESLQTFHDLLISYMNHKSAQTSPKCTPTVEQDWGPFGKHPNLKDGPIDSHPSIKY